MTLNRQQLEAISITAQNDAIALGEVYRASFKERMKNEMALAIQEELSEILGQNHEAASTIVETIAQAYADTIAKPKISTTSAKLLKPSRENDHTSDIQALLPVEKPKRLRSVA